MTSQAFKSWRTSLGLSQAQAAKALGLSIRQIKYLESGQRKVTRQTEILCDLLIP